MTYLYTQSFTLKSPPCGNTQYSHTLPPPTPSWHLPAVLHHQGEICYSSPVLPGRDLHSRVPLWRLRDIKEEWRCYRKAHETPCYPPAKCYYVYCILTALNTVIYLLKVLLGVVWPAEWVVTERRCLWRETECMVKVSLMCCCGDAFHVVL